MPRFLLSVCLLIPTLLSAQGGSEIYVFDIAFKNKSIVLANPVNISNHKGYDNQPSFHPTLPIVYYTSADDSGRTDIRTYDYVSKVNQSFTSTSEREYSPTVTPDHRFISCIIQRDNGQQDLGKYPIGGGKAEVIIDNLKVGYHTWIDASSLLLFVLADSTNDLHYYNSQTKEDKIIANQPGRSLHKIPDEQAFSFIDKSVKDKWVIKRFDAQTKTISPIVATSGNWEDITWTAQGVILASNGDRLLSYKPKADSEWQTVATEHLTMLKKITRLAINKANTKLAVVVSE